MASPVLLVADDLSLIAAVKRVLAREGQGCILATSAADAIIAFGHDLPALVLLQPDVESGRGQVILEELRAHPEAALLKVVLLGETIPGFGLPVEPLPLDSRHLAQTIAEHRRPAGGAGPGEATERPARTRTPPPQRSDLDTWRTPVPDLPGADEATLPPAPELSLLETVRVEGGALSDTFPRLSAAPAQDPDPEFADTVRSRPRDTLHEWADFGRRRALPLKLESDLGDLPPPTDAVPPAPTAPMGPGRSRVTTSPQFPTLPSDLEPAVTPRQAEPPAPSAPPPPPPSSPSAVALADRLFGDLPALEDEVHRDVEAEAMASLESSLALQEEAAARRSEPSAASPAEAPTPPPPWAPTLETPPPLLPSGVLAALARAEAMASEGRDGVRARREDEAAQGEEAQAALALAGQRAEEAEDRARQERQHRASLEDEVVRLRELVPQLEAALAEERATHLQALDAARAHADVRVTQREQTLSDQVSGWQRRVHAVEAALEKSRAEVQALAARLGEREGQLDELGRRRDDKVSELTRQREERLAELTRQQGEAISALTRRHDAQLAELKRALAEAMAAAEIARAEAASTGDSVAGLEHEQQAHDATRRALAEAEAQAAQLQSENALIEEARTHAELGRRAAAEAAEQAEASHATAERQRATLEAELATARELLEEAGLQRQRLDAELGALRATITEARSAIAAQEQEKASLREELERGQLRQAAAIKELAQARDALDQARTQAEQAEATAALAHQKIETLERRNTVSLALPGRRPLGVPRHGELDLDGLAELVGQLVLARADVGLTLGVSGGERSLWLTGGQLVGASSTFEGEGLVERARQDGLIDGRQEAELKMVKRGTVREQLEALKARRMIREVEAVPLVQRHAEHLALQAFSEAHSQYRLTEEAPGPEVTRVSLPRPTLPLLAEALRRAVDPEALLTRLGGGDAVPRATDAEELDLRALGFSDRERRLLGRVDGETTVETLALESGLRAEAAFRALLVARLLGAIALEPAPERLEPLDPEVDARRLLAKYDQVVDADYFSALGLTRLAGADEVRRAFERLREEFHPLRFSGHPDAGLQERAHQVFQFLEEAARALEDDGRRAEYARHLLD